MALEKYLGKSINDLTWLNSLHRRRFKEIDARIREEKGLQLIDYLVIAHNEQGKSLRDLDKEVGICRQTLVKIFDTLNLPRLTRKEAVLRKNQDPEHLAKVREANKRPEVRAKISKSNKEAWQDPECRKKHSEMMKKRWADEEYYERVMPKIRATLSRKHKEDPEYVERLRNGARRAAKDPERNRRVSEGLKRRFKKDPEYAEASRKRLKKLWEKDREKMLRATREAQSRPEVREKIRRKTTERWKDPEYREKIIEAMKIDKKNRNGKIYFILPREIGKVKEENGKVAFSVDEKSILEYLEH